MNKNQVCVGSRSRLCPMRPSVAGGDVHRVRTMAAIAACVTDRRMIAQGLIWVRVAQGCIDLLLRENSSVPKTVGTRRIVWRSLMPETHESRGAVGIEKIRVGEVQPEIQRCYDAAASSERRT